MMLTLPSEREIWTALEEVKDPEIPVVSVVEMGIVRSVALDNESVTVAMTPTFSGCPALRVMHDDIEARGRARRAEDTLRRRVEDFAVFLALVALGGGRRVVVNEVR